MQEHDKDSAVCIHRHCKRYSYIDLK